VYQVDAGLDPEGNQSKACGADDQEGDVMVRIAINSWSAARVDEISGVARRAAEGLTPGPDRPTAGVWPWAVGG
jgi:hypothetical protein